MGPFAPRTSNGGKPLTAATEKPWIRLRVKTSPSRPSLVNRRNSSNWTPFASVRKEGTGSSEKSTTNTSASMAMAMVTEGDQVSIAQGQDAFETTTPLLRHLGAWQGVHLHFSGLDKKRKSPPNSFRREGGTAPGKPPLAPGGALIGAFIGPPSNLRNGIEWLPSRVEP